MYLGRYQRAIAKIAELEQFRQTIETDAVTLKGIDNSSVKVQSSKHSDKVSAPVVSVVAIDEKLTALRERLPDLMKNTTTLINKLPSKYEGVEILDLHFCFGYKLPRAGEIIGVSRSQAYVLYHKALDLLLGNGEVRQLLERYKQRLIANKRKK